MGKIEEFIAEGQSTTPVVLTDGGTPVGHTDNVRPSEAAKQKKKSSKAAPAAGGVGPTTGTTPPAQKVGYGSYTGPTPAQQQQAARQQQRQRQAAARTAGTIIAGGAQNVTDSTQGVVETVGNTVGSIGDWVSSRPTPGGIFVLLAVIFVFLWLVVPVNGKYTRAHLLWLTLFEQSTTLPGSSSTTTSDSANAPSSGGGVAPSQMSLSLPGTSSTVFDFSTGASV